MREIPQCMINRYQAVDELVEDLTGFLNRNQTDTDDDETESQSNEASIKLMCEFWNILKEDPNCNLPLAVKRKMGIKDQNSSSKGKFGPKKLSCFMARFKKDKEKKEEEPPCCPGENEDQEDSSSKCCTPEEAKQKPNCCNPSNDKGKSSPKSNPKPQSTCCAAAPLNKALCNLKQAVSFDKKCEDRIQELQQAQEELTAKVKTLEGREKQGKQMLKQADEMWNKMEKEYKMKIDSSILKQNELIKHLKEVDKSKTKWRKNKKDLELQMTSLNKCSDEIKEKMNQKTNDMKCMELEIADLKKRIEIHARDTDSTQKSLTTKKVSGDKKVQSYMVEIEQLQKLIDEENRFMKRKEEEGNKYIRVAREDLQKLCRMQLQKKLEAEDLMSEVTGLNNMEKKSKKEGIEHEILFLQQTYDTCKDKCNTKKLNLQEELKKIDKEITSHRNKCIKCHRHTDTSDIRNLCIDCPKCKKDRECKTVNDHCVFDPSFDCVCMATKRNFLNNVFENMYTVLARNSKSNAGKAVAEHILQNLHNSRNGKLNAESRRLLQDFILTVVKNNLNLTIVGGAVKTRCEMDADTYKQLMSCLTSVKVEKPTKTDKGTVVMKEPCRRWGGETECHCPKGPSGCICNRKLPPSGIKKGTATKEEEMESEVVLCPRDVSADLKGPVCSVECGARHPGGVWQPTPCGPSPCFGQRSRTVQCAMDVRPAPPPPAPAARPAPAPPAPVRPSRPRDIVVSPPISGKKNGEKQKQNFFFKSDRSSATREKIVEEVIGQFEDEMSDESVSYTQLSDDSLHYK